jgi:hypothetical protein
MGSMADRKRQMQNLPPSPRSGKSEDFLENLAV